MVNKFDVRNAEDKIKFLFAAAKEIKKDFPNAPEEERTEMLSCFLKNNDIRHSVIQGTIVVHDLRIMDQCCESAWFMDMAAVAAEQITEETIRRIFPCPLPTIICQKETGILPMYVADDNLIVIAEVLSEISYFDEQEFQIVQLTSDAKTLTAEML